jgi:hypothetical protein
VRFWDSSAIVPLIVLESASRRLQSLAVQDPGMLVWRASAHPNGAHYSLAVVW